MSMYAQFACWDEGLGVALDDRALAWLDDQGSERRISINHVGRRIALIADDTTGLSRKVVRRGPASHVDFRHGCTFEWHNVSQSLLRDLPRFALTEVKLQDLGLGFARFDLPGDHLLPWPKLRDCRSYTVPEQIVKDLEKRMRSAREAAGGAPPSKWTWVPMPERFRAQLARGVYADVLRAVIDGVPYGQRVAA